MQGCNFVSEQFCFYLNTKRLMWRRFVYLGRRGAKNFIGGTPAVETFDQLQQRIPERIIEHDVRGMLPKGRLGRQLLRILRCIKVLNILMRHKNLLYCPIRDKRIQKQAVNSK
ncbi:hypothetical protein RDI58_010535 [Solanum bulbocastanum]|uniref:Uncharacterized protein n=1 Tax=Solanum bulbocastanum TaxID=147425 RepID=A0AAN8YFH5_SOLBU